MNLSQEDIDLLVKELDRLEAESVSYFKRVWDTIESASKQDSSVKYRYSVIPGLISETDKNQIVPEISESLAKLIFKVIETSKSSPLVTEVDRRDLGFALRGKLASLKFHTYSHWETRVLNDEDRVLGVAEAGQSEDRCSYADARRQFQTSMDKVKSILRVIFPTETPVATAIVRSESPGIKKYRRNSAFIMMWISKEHPELEDVKNCFKNVFKQFGINAVRSDEIEHGGVITERILDEISTAEFLIADLTGERPSVYYEVGYAHAIGQRPILYRKEGTKLHFDLSVHNCPEYSNLTDLRQKLQARLSILTNKKE